MGDHAGILGAVVFALHNFFALDTSKGMQPSVLTLFGLDRRFRFTAPGLFNGAKVEPAWPQANSSSLIQPIGTTNSPIMRGVA